VGSSGKGILTGGGEIPLLKATTIGRGVLDRQDWLLLFIGAPSGPYATDQIRVMKGMFLVSKEGPDELRGLYHFQPYDYGPFDTTIYHDLGALELRGLIRVEPSESTNRRIYRLTRKGQQRTEELTTSARGGSITALRQIKEKVTSLSFLALLNHVYKRYPAYAVKSVLTK
jgi:DNA-binding PadR family transcriptional regulator